MEDKLSILLVIPCFNEASNIGKLLEEIRGLKEGYDTIVIDDGSCDETYTIASHLSSCIRLITNLGIGGAVQTGIKYAREKNYDLCIQVDGDGQHPPDQTRLLIENYKKSSANLVIGSRFIKEEGFRSTWARRLGINLIGTAIKWLYGTKITDPTSGLRLMDRKAMDIFSKDYHEDFPEPIAVAKALESGLSVQEVPVTMNLRKYGNSSITGRKKLTYMLRVIGYIILMRLGRLMRL
ncbi:MAG: glycosyltransferase family 2 protein [bacterium]|nr:glycosyltransferase family 2 protein [bacterium]